jgi:hemerythrin-like metal-binding protein
MFEFSDEYLVGVTAIDQQHRQLFLLAERFRQAVATGRARNILDETLDGLLRYTESHFNVEERLMASIGYPERPRHAAQHSDICNRLDELQQRFDEGDTAITIEILQFFSRSLIAHITSSDRRLGEFHRASRHGAKPPTVRAE